jgi:L-fucose isomerase-like protein
LLIGFPVACEGDVDGALSCLVGKLAGCGAIYLSDWLEHDKTTLTLWHGGMAPFQVS